MSILTGVTNFFSTANEGFSTTLASTIAAGATTVPLNNMAALTNGTVFVGIVEPGSGSQQTFTGIVNQSTTSITGVIWTRGTNVPHTAGVTVVDYVTGTDFNMMSTGMQVSHNQNGTLKSGLTITTPTLITPTIASFASATHDHSTTANGGVLNNGSFNWATFSNNIKSATNASSITLNNNASQDLASNGLTLSFTCTGTAYAFVSVSLGVASTSDFEFGPEIRLGGTVSRKMQPSAATGSASSRSVVRGFSYLVTLANGVNTLSAGVTITSGTGSAIAATGGIISAIVLGQVTA